MPSTTTLPASGRTRSTRPVLGASSPAITWTVSSLRMCMAYPFQIANCKFLHAGRIHLPFQIAIRNLQLLSNHLGGEADDFQIPFVAQLTGDRAEDARPFGIVVFLVEDHEGVAVETHVTA